MLPNIIITPDLRDNIRKDKRLETKLLQRLHKRHKLRLRPRPCLKILRVQLSHGHQHKLIIKQPRHANTKKHTKFIIK